MRPAGADQAAELRADPQADRGAARHADPQADPATPSAVAAGPLRRRLLISAPLLALGGVAAGWLWQAGGGTPAEAQVIPPVRTPVRAHRFSVALNVGAPGTPVNRRVLGSNVQWVDNGDDMLGPDFQLEPTMLSLAKTLSPAVLRYPGGAQSDNYHWLRGIGPQATRGLNNHVNANTQQVTRMGTAEFLELCEATGAEPLITVNLVTGTPEEAAAWLTATNVTRLISSVTGALLPRVGYWELGNEPYLKQDSRPDLDIAPDVFASRANAFIRALRAVDPTIRIGLPLTSDARNGVPVTPYPGFSRQVLAQVTEPFDFVAAHDAYMPFSFDGGLDRNRHYWGAMAATRSVAADFAALRTLLNDLRPGQAYPLAVTEYNAMFTLSQSASDNWITSPAGALYVADVLRLFAATPDLLLANQWSLSGNWKFGTIHSGKYPRPVFEAMRLVGDALRGDLLAAPAVTAEAVATVAVGLVGAVASLPLVEVMATREVATPAGTGASPSRTVRVLLIQKDPVRSGAGRVQLDGVAAADVLSARLTLVAGSSGDVFDARDVAGVTVRSEQVLTASPSIDVTLPPCSLALLTVALAPA